jgi:glycosyltransferase involved in cell wall biosynthesis
MHGGPILIAFGYSGGLDDTSMISVHLVFNRLPDKELETLMRSRGVHLCPFSIQAFGRSIAESMSASAVIVTTNAPAMTELVESECGILVQTWHATPMCLDQWQALAPTSLRAGVERDLS